MELVFRRSSFIWQGWSMPGKSDGNLHGHQCTFLEPAVEPSTNSLWDAVTGGCQAITS